MPKVTENKIMSWLTGIAVFIGFMGYLMSYVYPRSEAAQLESRVSRIEQRYLEANREILSKLQSIEEKIDKLYDK